MSKLRNLEHTLKPLTSEEDLCKCTVEEVERRKQEWSSSLFRLDPKSFIRHLKKNPVDFKSIDLFRNFSYPSRLRILSTARATPLMGSNSLLSIVIALAIFTIGFGATSLQGLLIQSKRGLLEGKTADLEASESAGGLHDDVGQAVDSKSLIAQDTWDLFNYSNTVGLWIHLSALISIFVFLVIVLWGGHVQAKSDSNLQSWIKALEDADSKALPTL